MTMPTTSRLCGYGTAASEHWRLIAEDLTTRGLTTQIVVPDSEHGGGFHRIPPDWVIDNSADDSRLSEPVRRVVDQYLAAGRVGS